jgi:hypothetical protein
LTKIAFALRRRDFLLWWIEQSLLDVKLGGEAAFVCHRPPERPIHLAPPAILF